MTALPGISTATSPAATEGDLKNFLTNQRAFLDGLFGTSGEKPATRAALQVPLHSKTDKSGAYTVVAADQGRVLNCSGTWTLSLAPAATLGDGFLFAVMNSGVGTITIDPSSTEKIDGLTTKTLSAAKLLLVYCNGTSFSSVGSVDSESILTALGYTPAGANRNFDWELVHTWTVTGVYVGETRTLNIRSNWGDGIYYVTLPSNANFSAAYYTSVGLAISSHFPNVTVNCNANNQSNTSYVYKLRKLV